MIGKKINISRLLGWMILVTFNLPLSTLSAQAWRSHLAYNNVTQIAMSDEYVYAISDGSLYSVSKQTEQLQTFFNGLQGTGITCIHYDELGKQLIVGYETGKIDILSSRGVKYIAELYEKDMTQRKTIHNVTIDGRTAYLSTSYGIQTFDLEELKLVDSYWLRPGGEETDVEDVLLTSDSVYAFTQDSMFCASFKDNMMDYTYWRREKRSSRIQPDPDKGKHYADSNSQWYAGGKEGIIREMLNERNTYKPQGPLNNVPYTINASQGDIWVVSGGRWSAQFNNPGVVMHYNGEQWINIETDTIVKKTGHQALDFMNVAIDPADKKHYFVTSFGTGLYEFYADNVLRQIVAAEDNTIVSVVAGSEYQYTRLDAAIFDSENNLWFLCAAKQAQLQCLDASGNWHAVDLKDGSDNLAAYSPNALFIDCRQPNYKWLGTARYNTCVYLLDDRGTRYDGSDDRYQRRTEWTNQFGRSFAPANMRALMQDSQGRVWMGTDLGVAYIDAETDFFSSDAIMQPDIMDDNGENPIASIEIYALCEDQEGNIWIGTAGLGVYVLDKTATKIVAHYTTDNSTLASNAVLSLAVDVEGNVFVGTSNGLAEYQPNADPVGAIRTVDEEGRDLGSIMQWKLHMSYSDMKTILATPERICALSNGSLCYVDRADDNIRYMNKTTGLNGSTVTCIGYDKKSQNMVIGYVDGRIDLVDKNDNVRQLPDLYMKGGSIDPTINSIYSGSEYVYMAMTFGILAINPRKAEVAGTYYVDSASIKNSKKEWVSVDANILRVVEKGDTLYAFSDSVMYAGALKDNLQDYAYWHRSPYKLRRLREAASCDNEIYAILHDSLYRLTNSGWQLAVTQPVNWIHSGDNRLLVDVVGLGTYQLEKDGQLTCLTNHYLARDGVYTRGEYWLLALNKGIVRLQTSGDEVFVPKGPNSNIGYFMRAAHGRIYSTVGERWDIQKERLPQANIYNGSDWEKLEPSDLSLYEGLEWIPALDPVSIAVDPNDPDHFYVASYCAGVYEYNHHSITRYGDGMNGSTLKVVNADPTINKYKYTRTDGAMMDDEGNLWVLNSTSIGQPVHVMTPDHKWYGLPLRISGTNVVLATPAGLRMDRRDSKYKWFLDQRYSQAVYLLNDGGTPTRSSDDRFVKRSVFEDQNGNKVSPSFFYCMEQDRTNRMWIGTENGVLLIPESTDFFSSNECYRIIIPRNDGTGLGDYLLANEQINCMAVDGGNRMWIGTAGSGLYLIEDDTVTIAHFTENNSTLPSNNILSIAIIPETGEVFVGTGNGIASYLSDASEPRENMDDAYAFPNPVRPDYGGFVSITGLMDNTEVNIIDAGGNLVCKTRSNGGTAVWDCKRADGRMATAGVYTALCNTKGGKKAVKIMIIR